MLIVLLTNWLFFEKSQWKKDILSRNYCRARHDNNTIVSFHYRRTFKKNVINVQVYSISSSSSDTSKRPAFWQLPLQLPHAREHFIPCFLQLHLWLLQSVLQLHLMTLRSYSGAGGTSVEIGDQPVSVSSQPHSFGNMTLPFHWQIWLNTLKLWNFDAAAVGGRTWGWTWAKLVATFSQNLLYLSVFKDFHCKVYT